MPLTDDDIDQLTRAAKTAPADLCEVVGIRREALRDLLNTVTELLQQREALQARGSALVQEVQRVRDPSNLRALASKLAVYARESTDEYSETTHELFERKLREYVGAAK